MADLVVKLILYLAPLYFANSSAMLLGGKTPVDLGWKFFDGKPVFGSGKTFRGLFFGVAAGTAAAVIINRAMWGSIDAILPQYVLLGFLLSLGALLGDMTGSFLKRRFGIEQGKPVFLLDQLDFVAGGILLGLPVYAPGAFEIAVIAVATLLVHRAANYLAFSVKLKKVPW